MASYLFTPNPLSSKEYLRELLPDFVIQSLHCLEMLATIHTHTHKTIYVYRTVFVLETQYRNMS